jgi:GntR family transcriptional regulator
MSDTNIPRYHTVYLQLKQQIAEGRFDDSVLPGEHALAGIFGVSRVTMRHALGKIEALGWIERRPGLGTVTRPALREHTGAPAADKQVGGLLGNLISVNLKTAVEVLEYDTVRDAEAARLLMLEPGSACLKVVRIRSWNERPFSCITTHVPDHIAALLDRRKLEKTPMLSLIEQGGVKLCRATQSISAQLADPETAQRLKVDAGSALLVVRRVIFDENERPIQSLSGRYVPELYEYRMSLSRGAGENARIWLPA